MPDEKEGGGPRTPEEIARAHESIQREAENQPGRTPGGLTSSDIWEVAGQQRDVPDATSPDELQRDHSWIAGQAREGDRQRAVAREAAAKAERDSLDAPAASILDSIEPRDPRARLAEAFGGGEAGRSVRFRTPEQNAVLMRVVGLGMALAGIVLLWQALQAQGLVATPGTATAAPATFTLTPRPATPSPAPTTARPVVPLSAGPIVATQSDTTTSYAVADVKGEGLRYRWAHSATCASHAGEDTATYSWDHPHPPCPDEPFHTSFITVQITDASGQQAVVRQYTLGSRAGRGQVPAGGGVFTPQQPSPATVARSATPTPTAAPTTTPTSAAVAGTTSGPNLPLAALGLVLTLGGLGVMLGGPRLAGGPLVPAQQAPDDPCARERAREAAARARRDAAVERLRRIRALSDAVERTRGEAEAAKAAAKAATQGASSYVNNAKQTVYTNAEQRARIEQTESAARSAEAAAAEAQSAYDAAGGNGERSAASDEDYRAERDWKDADESLRRCLGLFAPPVAAPTGGGATAGPGGGPTVATPPTTGPTQVRECDPPGAERARPGAPATTESVWVPNLRGATLKFDSDMRAVTDFPIDDFLDWAQFTKESFFAGKKIVSLSEGLGPDGGFPVGGALDLVDFPDFLTYYDKMIDMALKALKKAADQQALIAKNGDYWLEYSSERFELRCEPWQRCVNGRWVNFGKSSFVSTGETRDGQTDKRQVTADPSAIQGAVQDAINRCFRQIEAAKTRAENQARQFAERCR